MELTKNGDYVAVAGTTLKEAAELTFDAMLESSVADVGMITYTDLLSEFVGREGEQWRQIVIGTRRIFLIMRMDTGKSPKDEKTIEGLWIGIYG